MFCALIVPTRPFECLMSSTVKLMTSAVQSRSESCPIPPAAILPVPSVLAYLLSSSLPRLIELLCGMDHCQVGRGKRTPFSGQISREIQDEGNVLWHRWEFERLREPFSMSGSWISISMNSLCEPER